MKTVLIPGDRRDLYIAEIQRRHLARGFLRYRVEHHLQSGEGHLRDLLDRAGETIPPTAPPPPTLTNA